MFESVLDPNVVSPKDIACPDGQTSCPDGNTCCELSNGRFGCCPLASAVCCSDGVHCCPADTTCNKADGKCIDATSSVPLFNKIEPLATCPDGESQCPSSSTCCQLKSGQYGCCPIVDAVCCSDGLHCCPDGYSCDVSAGTCTKGNEILPLVEKTLALTSPSTTCPDNGVCPEDNTCCLLSDGKKYGCCPEDKATCCSDHVHCCPNGFTCDVKNGKCIQGGSVLSQLIKLPTLKAPESVICPNQKVECPSGSTCCEQANGDYGCCPLSGAVCCLDKVHCCPEGYTCDTDAKTCVKGDSVLPFLEKIPPLKETCPDGGQCPTGTCCKVSDDRYGCCPVENAVCCDDMKHCCSAGYTCNNGMCTKQDSILPLVLKTKIASPDVIVCKDGKTQCPDRSTCCKVDDPSGYACCPLAQAVCCGDDKYCCPAGYTCAPGADKCTKGDNAILFLRKTLLKKNEYLENPETILSALKSPKSVICPDQKSECADGQTCCKLASGDYGCCPVPNAVCCSDGKHCCPEGYTCNSGMCSKQSLATSVTSTMPFLEKLPALKSPKNVVCPDGQSECSDGQTCCRLPSGVYGCCPQPSAVCCSDGVHCCPSGYTCDVSAGTCNKQGSTMPFLEKLPALKSPKNVVCPDGQSECSDGQTCCRLPSGVYGCCPQPSAVCCSDGVHCCPSGYTCDVSAGTCNKQGSTMPFLEKLPALKSPKNVVCPDGQSQCNDGQTCCKLSSGVYGCCPIPNAVCCSDGKHCCPSGYTCDPSAGTCSKQSLATSVTSKKPALKATSPQDIVCPDSSYCPDYNICCFKNYDRKYGCCPEIAGVCCYGGQSCCPSGTVCNGKYCTRVLDLEFLMPSQMIEKSFDMKLKDNPCPNGDSCTDSQTCCELEDGGYGCCPEANANCCPDKRHCCPPGEQCDMSTGTCSGGNAHLSLNRVFSSPLHRIVLEDRDFL